VHRIALPLLALLLAAAPSWADDAAKLAFFESRIRPVLVEHCAACHSADAVAAKKLKGGLRVDTHAALLTGGDSGPAIVPGKPNQSPLLEALRYETFEMPPSGRLPDKVIADFEKWIADGAVDPREDDGTTVAARATASTIDFDAARAEFWAYEQPQRRPQPEVERADWVRRPHDGFVLARMEAEGLAPAEPADRRTWLRRVTFDLTGLPPTPEEVAAFLADTDPLAEEHVVDRLLASPHYGEHVARLWLDVARYAEDQAHIVGKDSSLFYPNAYLYRDWVIDALNRDLPFDRFVRLQLAADLVEPNDETNLAALGFLGLGPKYYQRNSKAVMADEWENQVDTVTRGLLGLTVACARCHDHKFDAIGTADYYALAGVFASTRMWNRPLDAKAETGDDGEAKKPGDAMHVVAEGNPADLPVFVRGDVNTPGPVAPRRFLEVLDPEGDRFEQGSGRAELADAIADPSNPLTARVIVNRLWARHFGRPLVGTPSNFGELGERPTHPDLLDDLAVRFVENGWSLKWLHREFVLSATYRQASVADEGSFAVNPENRWLSRMSRRRLSVEQWRDAVLAAAGRLDDTVGGKSIDPADPDESRRTLYSRISRLDLNPLLRTFDFPDPSLHAERRVETTTPLQKLFVLNSPFMAEQVAAFADRVKSESADDEARIDFAYAVCFGREPTDEERAIGLAYLREGHADERWLQYGQALLASNEMLYVD
jgi:cytochrome c553